MLEDNDFIEKLNKQSYTSSTQQNPLTVEDLRRTVNDLKGINNNATEENQYLAMSLSEYRRRQEQALYQSTVRKMTHQEIEEGFAKQYGDNKPSVFSAYQGLGIVQSQPYSMMRGIAVNGTDEDFNLEDHIKNTNIALQSSITSEDLLNLINALKNDADKEEPMILMSSKMHRKIKVLHIKSQRPHGRVLRKCIEKRINKRQKQQINKVDKAIKKLEVFPVYSEGGQHQ